MGETVRYADNTGLPAAQAVQLQEVPQHGTIGDFIGSSLEGVDSGFIRCVYNAKNHSGNTVTLLCEKMEGCCVTGCCPKDQFWMTGLIILLCFVLAVFCCGTLAIIICYQRTKSQQRRAEKDIYEQQQSRIGSEAGGGVGLYTRPTYQQYGTGGYPRTAAPTNQHHQHHHQFDPNLTQNRRF